MDKYIELAYKESLKSLKTDDVPVGAVIVENDKIIAKAHNTREKNHIITGHAEINAVEKACKLKKTWHLDNCELYVTLEPCLMCKEVIKQARIKKIYYICKQNKKTKPNKLEIKKINIVENYEKIIKDFFIKKREKKK